MKLLFRLILATALLALCTTAHAQLTLTGAGKGAVGGGGGCGAFPALSSVTVVGRYNAQSGNITTSGSNVTSATDLSGHGNTLTNSGTVPLSTSSAYNSQRAFAFNNSGTLTGSFTGFGTTQGGMFFVMRASGSTGVFSWIGHFVDGSSNAFDFFNGSPATIYQTDGAVTYSGALDTNYRMEAVFGGALATSDIELWVNGVNQGSVAFISLVVLSSGTLAMGAQVGGSNTWTGAIVEEVVYSGQLSSGDRTSLNTWETCTYGS